MDDWERTVKQNKMKELLNTLESLPKEVLNLIVYQLMRKGKITYHDLMDMHIKHLEELEKGANDNYHELKGKVVRMFCGHKKDYDKEIKGIMHYLLDNGMINDTHDNIDAK